MSAWLIGKQRSPSPKDIYGWGSSTVVHLLQKYEYLGHTVNFKTRKKEEAKKESITARLQEKRQIVDEREAKKKQTKKKKHDGSQT